MNGDGIMPLSGGVSVSVRTDRRVSISPPGGTFGHLGYGSEVTTDDVMDNFNVSISLTTVLAFYGIGLGTVLLSTIIPNLYILKLNPKKIMM